MPLTSFAFAPLWWTRLSRVKVPQDRIFSSVARGLPVSIFRYSQYVQRAVFRLQYLVKSAFCNVAKCLHRLRLAKTMDSIQGLILHHRVPLRFHQMNVRSSSK